MKNRNLATLTLAALVLGSSGCMTAVAAFQPENLGGQTIVLTTFDAEDQPHERVITPIERDGQLIVSANHWPRAWYERALANPDVKVRRSGETETRSYRAVPVSEAEREYLLDNSGFPKLAYLFTGFAPRQFLRLEAQ